jgi:anaerobic selenocysteine-containing dehydrogenase
MTDTARYADFVLPSTTQLEHFDVHGAWGHHYVSLNEPAIAPLGEAKSHGEIMRLLAARMGLRHPELAKSDQAIAESVLPEGLSLESLRTTGWCKVSPPRPDAAALAGRLGFSGSIAVPERPSDPSLLQLLTPKSHYFLNSSFANMARQRKAMRRPTLEMHPLDARERGLVDGERVVITNDRGSIRAWLAVTDAICPTVVALPGKWWGHPEETSAVANVLSPSAWSPGGQPAYNDTFVYVRSDTNGRAAPLDPPNS